MHDPQYFFTFETTISPDFIGGLTFSSDTPLKHGNLLYSHFSSVLSMGTKYSWDVLRLNDFLVNFTTAHCLFPVPIPIPHQPVFRDRHLILAL
jgi:hypothetical protein